MIERELETVLRELQEYDPEKIDGPSGEDPYDEDEDEEPEDDEKPSRKGGLFSKRRQKEDEEDDFDDFLAAVNERRSRDKDYADEDEDYEDYQEDGEDTEEKPDLSLTANLPQIDMSAVEEVEKKAEENFFSRMHVPGETKKNSTYKEMLEYLMNTYPQETREMLQKQLSRHTAESIRKLLEECEGLPSVYVDFGTKMYTYRNAFAKELLERNKNLELLEKGQER